MEEYIDLFVEESKEHVQALNDLLLQWEKDVGNVAYVHDMFRAAHTLKGMAGTMGFERVATMTHHMENAMDEIRHGHRAPTSKMLDLLFRCVDQLEVLIAEIEQYQKEATDVQEVINALHELLGSPSPTGPQVDITGFSLTAMEEEWVREAEENGQKVLLVSCSLVDACELRSVRFNMIIKKLQSSGEIIKCHPDFPELSPDEVGFEGIFLLLTEKDAATVEKTVRKVSEVKAVQVTPYEPKKQDPIDTPVASSETHVAKSIRVSVDKIDQMMSLFEEFIVEKARLTSISEQVNDPELEKSLQRINRFSGEMQNAVLSMRMMPIETVFNRFPRMVRNLAKELDKEIDFIIEGSDTELDRLMIDELGDPLVHLIRNSLDHGIEQPEERVRKGKGRAGKVKLRAFHKGNQAIVELSDDGNGINADVIKAKAVSNGVVQKEVVDTWTDQEVVQLIFAPGFSTAETVTDLSGRGVGLDVVKSKIEALGGTVAVETTPGMGSRFTISLPLTLSIIQTLVVKSGREHVVIPLSHIVETTYIQSHDFKTLQNEPVIHFRGDVLPVVSVPDVFGPSYCEQGETEESPVIILSSGGTLFALVVTELVGQQEIVLKRLDGLLEKTKNVSGATILGDGSIAFVLDCQGLIKGGNR